MLHYLSYNYHVVQTCKFTYCTFSLLNFNFGQFSNTSINVIYSKNPILHYFVLSHKLQTSFFSSTVNMVTVVKTLTSDSMTF